MITLSSPMTEKRAEICLLYLAKKKKKTIPKIIFCPLFFK